MHRAAALTSGRRPVMMQNDLAGFYVPPALPVPQQPPAQIPVIRPQPSNVLAGRQAVEAAQRARALAAPVVPHSQDNPVRQPGEPAPAHELAGPASDPWAAFDAPLPVQVAAAAAPVPDGPWTKYAPQPQSPPAPAPAPAHAPWQNDPIVARAPSAPGGGNPFDRFDPPGVAQAHPGNDPWAAFDGTPPAQQPAGPWNRYGPQPGATAHGEYGYAYAPATPASPAAAGLWDHDPIVAPAPGGPRRADDFSDLGSPAQHPMDFSDLGSPALRPGQRSGLAANAAAGVVEGGGDVINVASDPFGNLIGKPLGMAIVGAHDALAGPLGYEKFDPKTRAFLLGEQVQQPGQAVVNAVGRAMDAPSPDDVVPLTSGQQLVRAGTRGAAGMVAMGAPSASAGALVKAATLGATSGVGSQVAENAAPEEYKPYAAMAGGILVPGAMEVGGSAARSVVRVPLNTLAGYAGPAIGRVNPLLDTAGMPHTLDNGVPLSGTANQVRMAADRARAAMTDPAAVQQDLQNASAPVTTADGRPAGPTTFQLTRDPGLGMAQQQAAAGSAAPAFQARSAAQNDAMVGQIRGVADGGDPAALQAAIQRQAADKAAAADTNVQNVSQRSAADLAQAQALVDQQKAALAQRAQQAAQGIGGDLPPGSDAQVGAAVRAPIDAAHQAALAGEGDLWKAVDPNGTLAVDMTPVRAKANEIAAGIGPNAAKPSGDEAAVLKLANNLPDVQSFRDLQDLRQRLTSGIRAARSDPSSNPQTVSRLSGLLGSVHDAMSGAVNDAELPGVTAPAAGNASPSSTGAGTADGGAGAAPGVGSAVFTPSGRRIDVRYGVREAGDLTASQLPDGRVNPAYPQELQPRDRTRAASGQQINRIANTLEPERLGASASTAEGAPIVGPDGVVESGNGRTLAIQQAHAQGGPQSQAYRDYLTQQGYDVSGMRAPVLVRERTTPLTDAERPAFADDAGASPVLGMSAAERAAADAKRLPGDALDLWRGGDVTDARNRDFVRAFAQHVLPEGEHATFMTDDGALSTEGAARVKNALTQHAYGSNDLVSSLAEQADPNIRAFGGAMADASGSMAKLRSSIDAGNVPATSDLSKPLVEAANLVQDARRRGISIVDAVAQRDAFSQRDPGVEPLLRAAYGDDLSGRMSRAKFSSLLANYADEAQQQSGLFGANLSRADMVEGAAKKYGYGTGRASEAYASGPAPGTGAGAGENGNTALRPLDGPAGQADAARMGGASGASPAGGASPSANSGARNRSAVNEPAAQQLTANFDRAAAERYAAARQATLDRVNTFKNAPGVGPALQGGPTKGSFRMADSAVPDALVRSGPNGADVAKAYLKAGGTPEALADAAAFSLRQAAMKDGVIDPAAYAKWAKDRQSFLSQIPDAAEKFGAVAKAAEAARTGSKTADTLLKQAAAVAQRTVDDAAAARAQTIRDTQNGVAAKFLGGADPVRQVGAILKSPTAEADAAHLAQLTANDPEARAGLRRAVADYILRDLKGNAESATSTESALKGPQLRDFLRNSGPALQHFMSPEDMRGLQSVADQLAQYGVQPGKGGAGGVGKADTAGGGDTFLQGLSHHVMESLIGGGVGGVIGHAVAGPVGGVVGSAMGAGVSKYIQARRQAGLANVDQLVSQALLDPALMRTLMTKSTAANTQALMSRITGQLGKLSLVTAARGPDQQQRQQQQRPMPRIAGPQNPLFPAGAVPRSVPQNALAR